MVRRWRALVAILLALVALPVSGGAAYACSPAVSSDQMLDRAVEQAAVVAEGWVETISPRIDLPSGIEDRYGSDLFVPVEMIVRVVRVYKGVVATPLVFYGYATRRTDGYVGMQSNGSLEFPGIGSCLWPDSDPSGKYALLVLQKSRQNRLVATALSGTVVYDSPADASLEGDRLRVARRIPSDAVAELDDAQRGGDAAADYARAALVGAPLTLLAATALLVLLRRPRVGGR